MRMIDTLSALRTLLRAILLVIILLTSIPSSSQDRGFYNLGLFDIQHNNLSFSSLKGKKTVVVLFDAGMSDTTALQLLTTLDTIYRNGSPAISVIAIPMADNGTSMKNEYLNEFLTKTLHISFHIAEVSMTKKASGNNQHPVCKWLSRSSRNGHFNDDTSESGQTFIIDEKGDLYAQLKARNKVIRSSELIAILNRR